MKRADILDTAKQYVTQDRAADHGSMERNFDLIAQYWSLHVGVTISSLDVGIMMAMLKLARMQNNPAHMDNYIDCAGYMACAGEIAHAEKAAND